MKSFNCNCWRLGIVWSSLGFTDHLILYIWKEKPKIAVCCMISNTGSMLKKVTDFQSFYLRELEFFRCMGCSISKITMVWNLNWIRYLINRPGGGANFVEETIILIFLIALSFRTFGFFFSRSLFRNDIWRVWPFAMTCSKPDQEQSHGSH